jgi:hypothetical protein
VLIAQRARMFSERGELGMFLLKFRSAALARMPAILWLPHWKSAQPNHTLQYSVLLDTARDSRRRSGAQYPRSTAEPAKSGCERDSFRDGSLRSKAKRCGVLGQHCRRWRTSNHSKDLRRLCSDACEFESRLGHHLRKLFRFESRRRLRRPLCLHPQI